MPWAEDELAHLNGYGLTYEVRASGLYLHLPGVRQPVHEDLISQMFPRGYQGPHTVRREIL